MKNSYLLALLSGALLLTACPAGNNTYKGVPQEYHAALDSALTIAGDNAAQLRAVLEKVPDTQKEAAAFLISHMPERDLRTLSADLLVENITCAYKAKEQFAWGKTLPKELFLNDVLPYCIMSETREGWRKDFYERFSKYVANAANIKEAIAAVNKNIRNEVLVDYNTKRERADQSPGESIRLQMASCSGLSILLTDAFRSVGIPSRIAGTSNWHDKRGNHSWCEVWADGEWYFTEYYFDALNKSWFLSSAGQAVENSREHAIYATSFRPTGESFPMVWDTTAHYVHAVNVTRRYVDIYTGQLDEKLKSNNYIQVKVRFAADNAVTAGDNRIAVNVDVFDATGLQVDGGRTSDTTKDLNNILTFILQKNQAYELRYSAEAGENAVYKFHTKEADLLLSLDKQSAQKQ